MKVNLTPVIIVKLCILCECVRVSVVCGKEIWYNPEEVSIRQGCVRNCQESLSTSCFSLSCRHTQTSVSACCEVNDSFSPGFLLFKRSQFTALDLLTHTVSQVCRQEASPSFTPSWIKSPLYTNTHKSTSRQIDK